MIAPEKHGVQVYCENQAQIWFVPSPLFSLHPPIVIVLVQFADCMSVFKSITEKLGFDETYYGAISRI